MKISELLLSSSKDLKTLDSNLVVELLLSHVLNVDRTKLFLLGDETVDENDSLEFKNLVFRYKNGEPVAYLIENKEFYGLDFVVNENVLIPRPETEMLVDCVLGFMKDYENDLNRFSVIDVGTGCGNIAVSLACNSDKLDVTAVDISCKALEVAKKNAKLNHVFDKISFFQSDLLDSVNEEFDIIVANLPYIGVEKFNFVSKETYDFEPHLALFGGFDGLSLYEKLFDQIINKKKLPSFIVGEFGFLQLENINILLKKYFGEGTFNIKKDLSCIERMFVVRL